MSVDNFKVLQAELNIVLDELYGTRAIAARGRLLGRLKALLGRADALLRQEEREIQDRLT